MVYADQTAVQDYLPTGYAIGTKPAPSVTQVAKFLTDCCAEIESAVASRGLAVPVTTPSWWLDEVTRLNTIGPAALCLAQIFPMIVGQTPATVGSGSTSMAAVLQKRYDDRLSEIRKGIGIPVAVPVQESDLAPRSYMSDNGAIGSTTATDAWGDVIRSEPAFSRSQVF